MKIIGSLLLATLIVPLQSLAESDVEIDKNAGICGAYIYIAPKMGINTYGKTADAALNMASNSTRAAQFGANWIEDIKRSQKDKAAVKELVFQAMTACGNAHVRFH